MLNQMKKIEWNMSKCSVGGRLHYKENSTQIVLTTNTITLARYDWHNRPYRQSKINQRLP
jgi:hypothetical protein